MDTQKCYVSGGNFDEGWLAITGRAELGPSLGVVIRYVTDRHPGRRRAPPTPACLLPSSMTSRQLLAFLAECDVTRLPRRSENYTLRFKKSPCLFFK